MAYHVYRYRWKGIVPERVDRHIDPAFPITLLGTGPYVMIDVSADDSTKSELDEVLAFASWEFVEEDPITPLP